MSDDLALPDRVAVPRKRLNGYIAIGGGEAEWIVANSANVHRAFSEVERLIKAKAAEETTLLAGKPRVRIKVEVDWDGYAFPEDAADIYEAERVGQALGMEVPADNDVLVFMRAPRMLWSCPGERATDQEA